MSFQDVGQLLARFRELGATRIFCKRLAENDNSKQQIYLGGSFEVLSFFPFDKITEYPGLKDPNFKASLNFHWINPESVERAPRTQLILYPSYPEVRLSGFLSGCNTAPRKYLQPVKKSDRKGFDGRVLVFGTTSEKMVLAYLAPNESEISNQLIAKFASATADGLFLELTVPPGSAATRTQLIKILREIHLGGYHWSRKLDKHGVAKPFAARNGGGYTLEALLGVKPNANALPDYNGWEIKGYSSGRVTLMTPEPTGGYYGQNGVKAFVMKYGRTIANGTKYFTGAHVLDRYCSTSKMTLMVRGFDCVDKKITDVAGAIFLVDSNGQEAATWSFSDLIAHWNRKHAYAAYVPYVSQKEPPAYWYKSPVLLGENTNFVMYLDALARNAVIYDPGSKVMNPNSDVAKVKARNQFRIKIKDLNLLYSSLEAVPLA